MSSGASLEEGRASAPSVFVSLPVDAVLSGGSLQGDFGILTERGSALQQAVALHGKDLILSEHYSFVVERSVLDRDS